MQTKTIINPLLVSLLQPRDTGLALVPQASPVVTITVPPPPTNLRRLSELIAIGRTYHPICRGAFIEKRVTGYYHYERATWHTCALAAAYAGAFGPESVQRADFSPSMMIWELALVIGYRADWRPVTGPTGRVQPVSLEVIDLVDVDRWTRQGVAEWLGSVGL